MVTKAETTWRKVKLEEVLELIIDHRGKTPKKLGGNWSQRGIPAISAKNIKNGKVINESDIRYVSEELYNKWMPEKLEAGDILLTSEAPLGELFYLKKVADYCLSQRLFALRSNQNKLYSRFLYYFLLSPEGQHELTRRISGTAAEGIRQAELRQVEIGYPENLDEQKRIADVFSTFDDKIELNNKISQNLEQMAQAIFKEWFIEFRFPGYKKVKMVNSELGKIPEGWKVKKIKDIANIQKGLSYSSSQINNSLVGLPMLNLASFLRGGGFNPSGIKYYTGKYKDADLVKSGDIIIAMTDLTSNREVIGHPARVPLYSHWDKILISLDVCAVKTEEILRDFLYYLMMRKDFAFRMASSAGGTNIAHLSKPTIEDYIFVLPDRALLKQFHELVDPAVTSKNKHEIENQKLAALRDLLLPKLMSGDVKI